MKPNKFSNVQKGRFSARLGMRRQFFFRGLTLLLVSVVAFLSGCSPKLSPDAKQGGGQTRPPVPVLVAQAIETNVPVQLRAIGNVLPYSKVTIRSQITGQLKQVHFREGQEVKLGDPLFTIDPRPPQGALEQARANLARDQAMLENARIEFERQRKLFDSALISRDEFDKARANRDALEGTVLADQAAITGAALNVEFTSIRAPVDGVTGNLLVSPGNIVKAPDDAMLTVNQIHPIYVSFTVPEHFLPQIKKEMLEKTLKVEATFQKMSVPPQRGDLTFIDNAVDPTTGMIQLKATFPNENSALWPGQFVQVSLTLSEQPHVIVVPSQAIQNSQKGEFVFVVKLDQTVEMRTVVTGITRDGATVVEKELKAGETVVTDGQLRLVPGAKVNVKAPDAPVKTATAQTNSP
ncbi:MAG: efflux RND transporter periplasmic adaptor subunit [Verrucomicrobia bacterium]|nr:efflux RND transporter periplasmic adaptor subunit [Verrucomicrobiota bacterium]